MSGAWSPGQQLPTLVRTVSQEQVQRYATASGDHNPIHLDPAFAATTPFGRPVAHGMLVLAFLMEAWLERDRLRVRFQGPVFPGDQVTASGTVRRVEALPGGTLVECTVGCRTQQGEEVITGTASVILESTAQERP